MDGDLAAVLKRLSRASEAENEKFKGMAKAMMGAGAGLQEGLAAMRQAELESDSAVGQESKLVNAEVSGAEDQSRYAESEATSKLNEIENAANSQEQAASTNLSWEHTSTGIPLYFYTGNVTQTLEGPFSAVSKPIL